MVWYVFFFNDTATTEIYTLSLHDALPILANTKLDECRRRVQNETMGHRGRKTDPLYRARRLLTKADERLDHQGRSKLLGLLDAGDPRSEVRAAWHAKEVVRSIYQHQDHELAVDFVDRLGHDLQDQDHPPEVRSLGRTLLRWRDEIAAWHQEIGRASCRERV